MLKKESYYTNDGELISSRTTQFAGRFSEDKGYSMYRYGKTIMSKFDAHFPNEVTDADIGKVTRLSKRLQPKTNLLNYKGNKSNKPMGAVQIGKVIGLAEPQAKRFIKRMQEAGVIACVGGKEPRYYLNPVYFLNGRNVSDELYWMFKDQLNEHLPKWARDEYQKRLEEDEPLMDKPIEDKP